MIYPPAAEPYYRIDAVVPGVPDELVREQLRHWPYAGGYRPPQGWFDRCRELGIDPEVMIYETYPTRSQAGYDHGVGDCQGHEARAREVGHAGANMVVVSDGNYADAWDCTSWATGWADAATMPFFTYGALAVCESFASAARRSPLFIDVGNAAMIPETWGQGSIASQLVGAQANLSTPHDLDRVYVIFGAPGPTPVPPPPVKELDVIFQAANDATDPTLGITAGSTWAETSTRFLRVDPPANAAIVPVDGDQLAIMRQEKLDLLAGARAHNVDVGAVVDAAVRAVATSPKGTQATKVVMEQLVASAIHGVLG